MIDKKLAPICGLVCSCCPYLGAQCPGCGHVEGRPFWAASLASGTCPLYECCRNQRRLEHCGLCGEFPCKMFLELKDPNMGDEEFQESLKARQEALGRRSEIGTDNWLVEISGA